MSIEDDARSHDDQRALLERVARFYGTFNQRDWLACFDCIDPRLKDEADPGDYAQVMERYFDEFGPMQLSEIRIHSMLPANTAKTDEREFAYVIVSWTDKRGGPRHFQERWIKDHDEWFTRVVGLVVPEQEPKQEQEQGG
jgi:hypothetical protein